MPHGILQPMYDAARKATGNKPVTMTAAEGLMKALGKGDVVFIMTGAGYEPTMPKGESDGPPGAASLARILYRGLGAVPVYVNEACHADPIVASSEAAHLMVKPFEQARDRHLGAAIENAPTDQSKIFGLGPRRSTPSTSPRRSSLPSGWALAPMASFTARPRCR